MNREIVFRGKRVDNGEWVYGYPMIDNALCSLKAEGKCACSHDGSTAYMLYWNDDFHEYDSVRVAANTIGQYTGLTDKNGVKIFEGDIVWAEYDKPDIEGETHTTPEIVEYEASRARFIMRQGKCVPDEMDGDVSQTMEVIGNVWDNPELLEGDAHE